MPDFPPFVRNPMNLIASASQYTEGVEGYVFDGADGSQVTFWMCSEDRVSVEHAHDFDEYVFVVEGRCAAILGDRRIELTTGDELVIPRGVKQRMAVAAGTRTIHAFGGQRARRASGDLAEPRERTEIDFTEADRAELQRLVTALESAIRSAVGLGGASSETLRVLADQADALSRALAPFAGATRR